MNNIALRGLILITIVLFTLSASFVFVVMVKEYNNDDREEQVRDDTRAATVLTGRFVEHLIDERFEKMYSTAYAGETQDVLRSMVEYTDFVAGIYGHKGDFSVGLMDSGFSIINSINTDYSLCPASTIVNSEIAERVLDDKPYVGPVSSECLSFNPNAAGYVLLAVPIYHDGQFQGMMYEISTLLESINSYKLLNYFSQKVSTRLIIDDILRYELGTEEFRLLTMRYNQTVDDIITDGDNLVGFYSFYYNDQKLGIIYIREREAGISFECCPWIADHQMIFFLAPVFLFILLIILVMVRVNDKLGDEVEERTKHLRQLQERYQGLFEIIPEPVVLFNHEGEITECNSRFEKMMSGGNPIGANILYMIREKERFQKLIKKVLSAGALPAQEFMLTAGSQQVPVSVHACVVSLDEEEAVLSIMTDLSEYKKMQNSFYLAQKREVVGTLAAGMVHDFSNILQNISLQYSLLERADESSRAENMKNIQTVLQGAGEYLTSVLGYTKDKSEKNEEKEGALFVRSALDMVERVLPADISVEYEDISGGIKISGKQLKMTQMLINLCQNAADAMESRGKIHITTYAEQKPFGRFFCLSVKDSGMGMPEDIQDKIFKPFFTTKKAKGTGLGLATVRQIVLDMGGFIELNSQLGVGTEFILMFSESK